MLSLSHLIVIIIFALIFLGPDKIPQFLKSCGEGIVEFKKIINRTEESPPEENKKKMKNPNRNNKKFKSKKSNNKFKKFKKP
jgi:TatA/E family protein of Tat protein translocase